MSKELNILKSIRRDLEETKSILENQERVYGDQLHKVIQALRTLDGLSMPYHLDIGIIMNKAQNGSLELALTIQFFSKYARVYDESKAQAKDRIKMHVEIRDAIASKIKTIDDVLRKIEPTLHIVQENGEA